MTAPEFVPESRLRFDANEHRYFLDGVEIPSVSRILELRFGPLPDVDYIRRAAHRGSLVHLTCELFDVGDLDLDSIRGSELEGYLAAWKRYCERETPRGLVDVKSKGKTGKAPPATAESPEFIRHGLQLAAYAPNPIAQIDGACSDTWAIIEWQRAWRIDGVAYGGTLDRWAWAGSDERSIAYLWPDGRHQVVDYTPYNEAFDHSWRELLLEWKERQSAAEEERDAR